ncbi:MAG: YihY/virulence factor BrkB family protein [Anaerolineales bacterium]
MKRDVSVKSGDLDVQGPRELGEVVLAAGKDFLHDSGPQWAAAIAYYSLLSIPPLLLAIVSIAAYFVDPEWATEQATTLLGEFLPQGSTQIEDVIKDAIDTRGTVGLLSIGSLLWSGTRVFGAIAKALNIAFITRETYGFFKRLLVEFSMLLTVGLLFVVALAAPYVFHLLRDVLAVIPADNAILGILAELLPVLLLLGGFFLIYRFVPREEVAWEAAALGAGVATLLFVIARPLFTYYLQRFANYNLIYGSIAIVIILVFWAWIIGVILLFGGEITAHIQSMLLEKHPRNEVERKHRVRAPTQGQDENKTEITGEAVSRQH